MLGRINYDDFSPYRASGRSTQQVVSIIPPTIYLVATAAEGRHVEYLINKHTGLIVGENVLVVELPRGKLILEQYPEWFVEVDHWLRPQLPVLAWELITAQNHRYMEATNAGNDGHTLSDNAGGVPAGEPPTT